MAKNAFEALLYLYNKQQQTCFMYINEFIFLEASYMYGNLGNFSTRTCQQLKTH